MILRLRQKTTLSLRKIYCIAQEEGCAIAHAEHGLNAYKDALVVEDEDLFTFSGLAMTWLQTKSMKLLSLSLSLSLSHK